MKRIILAVALLVSLPAFADRPKPGCNVIYSNGYYVITHANGDTFATMDAARAAAYIKSNC